jgi:hypothetical protein
MVFGRLGVREKINYNTRRWLGGTVKRGYVPIGAKTRMSALAEAVGEAYTHALSIRERICGDFSVSQSWFWLAFFGAARGFKRRASHL